MRRNKEFFGVDHLERRLYEAVVVYTAVYVADTWHMGAAEIIYNKKEYKGITISVGL